MRTIFQPGQACYHLTIGGFCCPYRITFAVVASVCRRRITLRTLEGADLVVAASSLVHAGHCPACDEPAHAQTDQSGAVWSHCPRCQAPAEPTPPPASYYRARLGDEASFWPCLIARLALEGQLELGRTAFNRVYAATPRDGLQRAA